MRHGLKIAERGGKNAKKRAAVAVARKLSVLLQRLWVTDESFEPLRNAHRCGSQAAQGEARGLAANGWEEDYSKKGALTLTSDV
jgi:hypothetical protein